ncbi:MAG: hypothetical protein WC658_00930 [Candidatus Omnitrophota bacterium]
MKKLLSLLLVCLVLSFTGVVLAEDVVNPDSIPVPQPIGIDEPIRVAKFGPITLTEGWNLIAIPVIPVKPLAVEQFIKMVVGSTWGVLPLEKNEQEQSIKMRPRWQVLVVAVYKNGRFERYPRDGVTYNMVPGEAYFVYAQYSGPRPLYDPSFPSLPFRPRTTINIFGRPVNESVSLNLNRGWSGVSLMRKNYGIYYKGPLRIVAPPDITLNEANGEALKRPSFDRRLSLNELSKELSEQNIKAKRIAFWDADRQEWEQYELPRPLPSGPYEAVLDPGIGEDEGFFLLCEQNGLYIPGLSLSSQIPPIPPMPPDRVKYTGKVEGVSYVAFGPPPPYTHILRLESGESIFLKGIDRETEIRLEIARHGKFCTVEGVMTTMLNYNGQPDSYEGEPVDVLVVDRVYPANGRFYPIDLIVEAEKDLCARLGIENRYIEAVACVWKYTIGTCDIPASSISEVYAIGLVYGGNTHIYEGRVGSSHRTQETSIIVEYKGSRTTEYDENGNLILEL